MHPPRGWKGQGVADRQRGGCISILEQVLTVKYVTTVATFTANTTVNKIFIVITATMVSSVTLGY